MSHSELHKTVTIHRASRDPNMDSLPDLLDRPVAIFPLLHYRGAAIGIPLKTFYEFNWLVDVAGIEVATAESLAFDDPEIWFNEDDLDIESWGEVEDVYREFMEGALELDNQLEGELGGVWERIVRVLSPEHWEVFEQLSLGTIAAGERKFRRLVFVDGWDLANHPEAPPDDLPIEDANILCETEDHEALAADRPFEDGDAVMTETRPGHLHTSLEQRSDLAAPIDENDLSPHNHYQFPNPGYWQALSDHDRIHVIGAIPQTFSNISPQHKYQQFPHPGYWQALAAKDRASRHPSYVSGAGGWHPVTVEEVEEVDERANPPLNPPIGHTKGFELLTVEEAADAERLWLKYGKSGWLAKFRERHPALFAVT